MLADALILPPEEACCRARPLDCEEDAAADEEVLFPSWDNGFVSVLSLTSTAHAFVPWYDRFTMLDTGNIQFPSFSQDLLEVVDFYNMVLYNPSQTREE